MVGHGSQEQVSIDDAEIMEQGAFTEINIVPLVDIMLVLLVILMAGSTAILTSPGQGSGAGIQVNLPSGADTEEVTAVTNELVIAVLATGELIVRGQSVSAEELKDILATEAKSDRSRLVLIQADEQALHKRVVAVMEVARAAGLRNLAIATQPGAASN